MNMKPLLVTEQTTSSPTPSDQYIVVTGAEKGISKTFSVFHVLLVKEKKTPA